MLLVWPHRRPRAFNALNTEVIMQLRDYYKSLASDPRVRCLVLTGSEKAFAAGADIKEVCGVRGAGCGV